MSAEQPETPTEDTALDIQVAANSFDTENVAADNDEDVIELEYRNEAVFKRFARDIYQSEEAGIREPVANAITAVRRAKELYDITNGTVEITVQWSDDGEKYLILRDNGIGIPRRVLENVMSVIGNSTSRDDGDISGKFGMGFLACYMLVGLKGSFIMHSRSRRTGELISGLWRPGKFEQKSNLAGALDGDEYGTKFVFPLDEGIDVTDIRRWVKDNVEWAREPVVYREIHNGSEEANDEYGFKSFEDEYDENAPYVEIDNEFFHAVASPDANGRLVLLDSPIDGRVRTFDLPWSVDIRLKNENGIVVKGPHYGSMPVEDAEYKQMTEERQEKYVPESDLTDDDLQLPEPTGTRDTISRSYKFWQWLDEQLYDLYSEEISDMLDEFDDRYEFLDMDERDQSLVAEAVFFKNEDRVQQTAEEDFDTEIDDDLAEEISIMSESPRVVDQNASVRNLTSHNSEEKPVWKIMQQAGDEGAVFMGVTLSSQAAQCKADVVWDDHDNNVVVKLESADEYSTYENIGWRKLREIRKSTIDEFDVSDDVAAPFTSTSSDGSGSGSSNAGLEAPYRDVKVHYTSYGSPRDITAQDLDDALADAAEEDRRPSFPRIGTHTRLVLFPPGAERNISDSQWVVGEGVAAATCEKMVYDYLKEWEHVAHADEFIEERSDYTVHTSEGDLTLEEAVNTGKVVFHAMSDEKAALVRQQDQKMTTSGLFDRMAGELKDGAGMAASEAQSAFPFALEEDDTLVYAPVTAADLDHLRADLRALTAPDDDDSNGSDIVLLNGSATYYANGVTVHNYRFEFNLYARARLPEWTGHDEFESLLSIGAKNELSGELVGLTETLGKLHDNGIDPLSLDLTPNQTSEPTIQTSEGELPISTAEQKADYLVFHVLPTETVDLFRDRGMYSRLKEYVKQQSGGIGYSSGTDFSGSDIVYAPVTNAEAQEASEWLTDKQYYVYGDASSSGIGGDSNDLGSDIQAYAYARLPEWDETEVLSRVTRMGLDLRDEGWYFVETLAELHDSGVDPAESKEILPE